MLAAGLLLLPAVLGGHPSRLAQVEIRGAGWVIAALGTQVLIVSAPGLGPPGLTSALHVISYALAAGFVWTNRALPGLWVIGAGALLNGVTIAANGGTLPARAGALRTAGLDVVTDGFANSAALEHPRLWFLGDVFAIPAGIPLANVFSVGDVLILLGVAIAALGICGTRWTRPEAVTLRTV